MIMKKRHIRQCDKKTPKNPENSHLNQICNEMIENERVTRENIFNRTTDNRKSREIQDHDIFVVY